MADNRGPEYPAGVTTPVNDSPNGFCERIHRAARDDMDALKIEVQFLRGLRVRQLDFALTRSVGHAMAQRTAYNPHSHG